MTIHTFAIHDCTCISFTWLHVTWLHFWKYRPFICRTWLIWKTRFIDMWDMIRHGARYAWYEKCGGLMAVSHGTHSHLYERHMSDMRLTHVSHVTIRMWDMTHAEWDGHLESQKIPDRLKCIIHEDHIVVHITYVCICAVLMIWANHFFLWTCLFFVEK